MEEKELQKLISELQNGTPQQKRSASYKLSKSQNVAIVPVLIQAYEATDNSVRQNVIDALRNINSSEAFTFLQSLGISSEYDPTNSIGFICEKCGAKTQIGSNYTFVFGKQIKSSSEMVSSTTRIATNEYQVSESEPVFICNKCVILQGEKVQAESFKRTIQFLVALLIISIPISLYMNNFLYLLPILVLIFVGPLALVQYTSLQTKEKAPLSDYTNINNNPQYKFSSGSAIAERNIKGVKNAGEKLAIQIKASKLYALGMNAFFTHDEASNMSIIYPETKKE